MGDLERARAPFRVLAFLAFFGVPTVLWGGTTLPGQLLGSLGTQSPIANGDYVSQALPAPGLDTYQSFFVEIPPGTGQLVVQFFDADVGAGGGGGNHDLQVGGGFNTSVNYSLRDPTGALVAQSTLGPGACGACDNAWVGFAPQANPAPGHWEVRVDMSSAVTAGNDLNGFGIRAHDGTAGAGGVELNVYAESYAVLAVTGGGNSTTYQLHPYTSSGCVADSNDFDSDGTGAFLYTSRTAAFTQAYGAAALSGATDWANNSVTGWTTDADSDDYGVWRGDLTVTTPPGQSGNVVTYYMGAFNAADPPNGGPGPPPAAQPEANTLRLYLPTDGAAAPVKPYAEQFVRHVSGPNPPVVGATSVLAVTVRVVNPTPYAINFSAANTVTANVPGAPATYVGGSAQVSQGTIVSQPGGGGSGNVVWNPGTLGAGQTEILAYQVSVTPTVGGQRIPVTGAPGSNGTTARFVDETANTTQARATFTFGPLCEVAVTEALLTHAVLSSFDARDRAGEVEVVWETSSEVGTAGFFLFRYDWAAREWLQINGRMLPGLVSSPAGGEYALIDPTADPSERLTYALIEVESNRRTRLLGPFEVNVQGNQNRADTPFDGDGRRARRSARPPTRELLRKLRAARQQRDNQRAIRRRARTVRSDVRGPAAKIATTDGGLYLVRKEEAAEALGISATDFDRLLARGFFRMENRGEPVAWMPDTLGRGLLFFAEELDSIYTSENVYWLRIGRGNVMGSVAGAAGTDPAAIGFVNEHQVEEDRFAGTVVPTDPDSDFFYWDFLSSGHPSFGKKSFALDAPGVLDEITEATLTVRLQGATDAGVADEHHIRVSLNGFVLGESRWQGLTRHEASFAFPQSRLAEANTLELEGLLDAGVPYSFTYVDGFELSYRRSFVADGPAFFFGSDARGPIEVTNVPSEDVVLYDVTQPNQPRVVSGVAVDAYGGAHRARFEAREARRYLAVTDGGLLSSVRVWRDEPSRLRRRAGGAEHIVIAPEELSAAAQELVDYRNQKGVRSRLVLFEDVVDEFHHGIVNPHAVRDFLRYASEHWSVPPRYVVLAGRGTFDYKDIQGLGGNLLPPLMVRTENGLFASDARFADLSGNGSPDIAVGRLPVLTQDELSGYMRKLRAYESVREAPWQADVLLLADYPDQALDFGRDSLALESSLSTDFVPNRIHLGGLPLDVARDMLLASLESGSGHVSYMGHGGIDRLSSSALLTAADVAALSNAEKLSVVSAVTCTINRFGVPGFRPLGEEWVLNPEGGAIAVWSAVGLSEHSEAKELAKVYSRRMFAPIEDRSVVGDVIQKALEEVAVSTSDPDLLNIYQFFGDPALVVLPPAPQPSRDSDGNLL